MYKRVLQIFLFCLVPCTDHKLLETANLYNKQKIFLIEASVFFNIFLTFDLWSRSFLFMFVNSYRNKNKVCDESLEKNTY